MESGTKLKLLAKAEQFYDKLIPVLRRFPKTQRYTLAENIEKETLAGIRLIFQAAYHKSDRKRSLEELRTGLHLINFLLRVSHSQKFLTDGMYETLASDVVEMGKISSQWIKNENQEKTLEKRPAKPAASPSTSSDQLNL